MTETERRVAFLMQEHAILSARIAEIQAQRLTTLRLQILGTFTFFALVLTRIASVPAADLARIETQMVFLAWLPAGLNVFVTALFVVTHFRIAEMSAYLAALEVELRGPGGGWETRIRARGLLGRWSQSIQFLLFNLVMVAASVYGATLIAP
jgi:hypothetical protein